MTPEELQKKIDSGRLFMTPEALQAKVDKGEIRTAPKMQEAPWKARHPNLYGVWGAAKETGKSFVPYLKYVDPEERERFNKLTTQQQTRELLLQDLELVGMMGAGRIAKGANMPNVEQG